MAAPQAAFDLAEALVKPMEGCILHSYHGAADRPEVWTIGYGHTGPEVKPGQTITQEIADHLLLQDLAVADRELENACDVSALEALPIHRRAALIDFCYNVGAGKGWTIWKDVNDGNLADVPAQLRRFTHSNGKEVLGLEHRREAEIVYWNTADLAAAVTVTQTANAVQAPASGPLRVTDTAPVPQPAPPLAKTSLIAKAVTAAGGTAVAIGSQAQQIHGILGPYVDNAKLFQTLDTLAIGAIVIAAIVGLFIHEHQAQARTQ